MKREFVKTENAQRLATAIHLREARGAAESGLVVVHGRAGEGKTRTLHNWASTRRAVMLTAYPGWTPSKMMAEIAQVMHVVTRGTWEADIAEHIAEAETPLVVDEAGFALANSAACLERLRTITDKSGTLLVMALMQRDMARLCQYDQLTSRATLCEFKSSSVTDVGAACLQLAEVAIATDLVERIHAEAEGRMRLVIDAIHLVENVARSKGLDRVAAADLAGMRLCQDFDAAGTGGSRHRSTGARRGGR